jgi:hypothetical protein
VTLAPFTSQTVSVLYATVDGTATVADHDYVARTGTLTFSPGAPLSQTITIQVNGDTRFEPNETFAVTLSSPSAATIASGQGVGTISNDDASSVCSPRPNVGVTTAKVTAGQLQAILAARTSTSTPSNGLTSVRFTAITNAAVRLNGTPVTVGPSFSLPGGTQQATLLIDRHTPPQNLSLASTVTFVVTDACGDWKSFVGGGPGAF